MSIIARAKAGVRFRSSVSPCRCSLQTVVGHPSPASASLAVRTGPKRFAIVVLITMGLSACSNFVDWKEEVGLNDGRSIVVKQKRRCEGGDYRAERQASCISRAAWLTFTLPEFAADEIVWHSSLSPLALNVHRGRLYVIGFPSYLPAFREYGATNPPYFGFEWTQGQWLRIRFEDIPQDIYATNLLIENIPKNKTDYLSLDKKNSDAENGDARYSSYFRRVDPKFVMKPY